MRGTDDQQATCCSDVSPEQRVPQDHPLRAIRELVNTVLRERSSRFATLYATEGRPSIAPEKRLRAWRLQALDTVRSERLLMEPWDDHLLFRWVVGRHIDDPVWDATVFTKHRDRWLEGDVAQAFFDQILAQARERQLLSAEHCTVDGTLLDAWAGQQSVKATGSSRPAPVDDPGNPTVDCHGERRTNATHASTTDPEARLYQKAAGQAATLCYPGHGLMENRHGLVVDAQVSEARGTAARDAALAMVEALPGERPRTLGGDKRFDPQDFVRDVRAAGITPHVAQHTTGRRSAIDGRTTRHPGDAVSQRCRTRVEEIFGWLKTVGLMRNTRHRGCARVGWMCTVTTAVDHLVRMRHLALAP